MAISRPRLIEQEGLLGRVARPVAQPAPVAVAPQRVVAAPAAAPAPAPVPAPAAWAGHESFKTEEARKALRDWLSAGGTLPVEETDGGVSQGMAEVGDFIFRPNPDYYGGGYQAQRGNVTYAFDPKFNLQRSYTQSGNTVNTYDVDGSLIKSYTPQGGFGSFLKTVAPIALSAFGAPYLAGALGGGLGATIGAGALTGAAGSAIAGGDPLKGAVMGGIGGGIGYGVNNAGLLGSPTELATTNTLPTDLGLPTIEPIVPVELNLPDALPMPSGLPSVASLPGTSSIGSVLSSVPGYDLSSVNFPPTPAPGYSLGNPSLELPGGGLNLPPSNPLMDSLLPSVGVNNPPPVVPDLPTPTRALDSQLANEQLGIKGGENSVAPSTPAVEADPSLIERGVATGKQLLAAGKDAEFYKWVTDPANSLYVRAMMAGGGALLNTVGGESKSGGSSYKDDGYRPTISRGGFQASIPAPGRPSGGPGMAAMSGITLPSTGQANDGLWRYAGNQPGGFMPSPAAMPRSLISPPPMAPQTGLISPPAVSYNPRPTGPLPTNLPPMQYGYDDPVVNRGPQLTPEQQRLMSPLLGLLNTSPAPRGWM